MPSGSCLRSSWFFGGHPDPESILPPGNSRRDYLSPVFQRHIASSYSDSDSSDRPHRYLLPHRLLHPSDPCHRALPHHDQTPYRSPDTGSYGSSA